MLLAAGLWAVLVGPAAAAAPIVAADFDAIRKVVLPHGDESVWTQIPWGADLWQARRRAAAEGKPILLWEMDGHPLGCT
jgi:hypothetical protein